MRELIKIIGIMLLFFTVAFVAAKVTGFLSLEQIKGWLLQLQAAPPLYMAAIIIALLCLDLFITVPTLGLIMLSGYFLGYPLGVVVSITGLTLAGSSGYLLSHRFGHRLLRIVVKDPEKRADMTDMFHKHGFVMILLSRALPMLPEVTSCLSGATRLAFSKFIGAWLMGNIPYVLIAAYSGSISTVGNPLPALFTAIGITSFLWLGWFLFHRTQRTRA